MLHHGLSPRVMLKRSASDPTHRARAEVHAAVAPLAKLVKSEKASMVCVANADTTLATAVTTVPLRLCHLGCVL